MGRKLTRHNGRAGKNGVYNVKHNDRRFDVGNSEHIDSERTKENIYWDCYDGLYGHAEQADHMSFDAACRTMLFDICKSHGVYLDEAPVYGGRAYLEKQEYILMKQKEMMAEQEKAIE